MVESNTFGVWQPVLYSTHQLTKSIGAHLGAPATHTGTLDPMAEGVVVILTGDARYKKLEHAGWKKGYDFDIIFGLATESYDGMGFITKTDFTKIPNDFEVAQVLAKMLGDYTQNVPLYSAIKYAGKRLFELARNGGVPTELPKKHGTIFALTLLSLSAISQNEMISDILFRLQNLQGDFRQEKIIKNWQDFEQNSSENRKLVVAKIHAEVSRGLYVRSLSQDICDKLGTCGFVYNLVRTKNGNFNRENCLTLDQIFGASLTRKDLVSKTPIKL